MRHSALLPALVLACAVLGGCGHRANPAPTNAATKPQDSAPIGLPDPNPSVLGIPADTTLVAGTTALAAMAVFDRTSGFWAVTAASNANGAVKAPVRDRDAAVTPPPAETPVNDTDHAQAAAALDAYAQQDARSADANAPTVAAAEAPAANPAMSATASAAAHQPNRTPVTTRPIQVGTLSLPATVVPGKLHAERANTIPPAIAARYDLYLLRVPLAWTPAKSFDRPLQRIAGNLTLDANAVRAGWRLLGISARGFEGLRRGPDATFPKATGWWFKPKTLAARLAGEVPATSAGWHEDAASRPLTGTLPLFALILAPHDARAAEATITAAVSLSPGDEAEITLPSAHLHIDLQRPALVANAPAPAAAPAR